MYHSQYRASVASVFWCVLVSSGVSASWMIKEVHKRLDVDRSWISDTYLLLLRPFIPSIILSSDTRDIDLHHWWRKRYREWEMLTGRVFPKPVVFVLGPLVSSGVSISWMKKELESIPHVDWSWISETDHFVLGPRVSSGVFISWMKKEVQRMRNTDWSWMSETDLFLVWVFLFLVLFLVATRVVDIYNIDEERGP